MCYKDLHANDKNNPSREDGVSPKKMSVPGRPFHDHLLQEQNSAHRRFEAVLRREGSFSNQDLWFVPSMRLMALGVWCNEIPEYGPLAIHPRHQRVIAFHRTWSAHPEAFDNLARMASAWASSGFPVVKIGAKQAAAFMLTSVDQGRERLPWPVFFINVPAGLLCSRHGVPVKHILLQKKSEDVLTHVLVGAAGPLTSVNGDWTTDLENLAIALEYGVCMAINANTHVERSTYKGKSRHRNRGYREAPPPGTVYKITAPVSIDLRETVKEITSGTRKGGKPKVQFVVRGHWRQQPCGPRNTLRKRMWIEPYWKGPRDGVAAIRAYRVGKQQDAQPGTVQEEKTS